MINIIFGLPMTIIRLIQSLLPRAVFKATYKPTCEAERVRSEAARNGLRLVEYKAKQGLRND